jgi:hypothetical protein
LVVTLTQGKAENSINADEDEEEDENAQDDDIAKEVERGTFLLSTRGVPCASSCRRLSGSIIIVFGVLFTAEHTEKHDQDQTCLSQYNKSPNVARDAPESPDAPRLDPQSNRTTPISPSLVVAASTALSMGLDELLSVRTAPTR